MKRVNKTLYDTLGLKPDASKDEIKAALRDKAKQCHPDHHPNDAAKEDEFKAVSAAYKVLSDPRARKKYDDTGEMPSGNDITARAYGMIITTFKQFQNYEGDSIFYDDPIKRIKKAFQAGRKEALTKICQIRKQNKHLAKIGQKLKHKGKGNSFIHYALADEQRQNKSMIQAIRNEIMIIKKALELIEDYSFDVEARTPSLATGSWSFFVNVNN